MKKLISIFVACFIICGCGEAINFPVPSDGAGGSVADSSSSSSSSSSTSSSSGQGGEASSDTSCKSKQDGEPCSSLGMKGSCFERVCVCCNGSSLGEVHSGFPLNPGSCYSFVCKLNAMHTDMAYN